MDDRDDTQATLGREDVVKLLALANDKALVEFVRRGIFPKPVKAPAKSAIPQWCMRDVLSFKWLLTRGCFPMPTKGGKEADAADDEDF